VSEGVGAVSARGESDREPDAAGTTPGPDADEPEILEGLARDIVSRLAATLFGEDDVPVWERNGSSAGGGLGGAEAPAGTPRAGGPKVPPFGSEARRVDEHVDRPAGRSPPGRESGRPSGALRVPVAAPARRRRLTPAERPALLVRGTVRSGRQIRHNGDVIVLGDVNPGGQVVAAGDVVVMGTLRGMVHAGATGEHTAVVAAFRLAPTQLRIASYLARPPEEPGGHPEYPELALVRDGVVVVRPLGPSVLPDLGPAPLRSNRR
jgi:septum site-determining protein MinC